MKFLFLSLLFPLYLFALNGFVPVNYLQEHIKDKDLVLLDVTDMPTYMQGHIADATLFDFSLLRKQVGLHQEMQSSAELEKVFQKAGINSDSKIVIYGHGQTKELLKESYLATALIVNGAKNVAILDGGYLAWTFQSTLLSSTKPSNPKDGNFSAQYNPDIIANFNDVNTSLRKVAMLDSRAPENYYGTVLSNGVKREGHISGAMSSFWKDKFLTDETLRSDADVKEIFLNGYNLNKEDLVIVYCTGGLEASMNWYILHSYLGFKHVKLYDASLKEWGNRSDTAMTRYKWEIFTKK